MSQELSGELASRIGPIIALEKNLHILTYEKKITDQIPPSYAANAFNTVREAVHFYLFVRLSSFWDRADLEGINIPTVLALIEGKEMAELIRAEHLAAIRSGPPAKKVGDGWSKVDPDWFQEIQEKRDAERANAAVVLRDEVILAANEILQSDYLNAVRNHRDKYAAHILLVTAREKKEMEGKLPPGVENLRPPKFGDETTLLEKTVPIIDHLNQVTRQSGYAFDFLADQHDRCARELWENCTITIPDRTKPPSNPTQTSV